MSPYRKSFCKQFKKCLVNIIFNSWHYLVLYLNPPQLLDLENISIYVLIIFVIYFPFCFPPSILYHFSSASCFSDLISSYTYPWVGNGHRGGDDSYCSDQSISWTALLRCELWHILKANKTLHEACLRFVLQECIVADSFSMNFSQHFIRTTLVYFYDFSIKRKKQN